MTSFTIREATDADVSALARVHVTAWNATYPGYPSPPTYELRESQWRAAFRADDPHWFCFAVERGDGELVGFAQGNGYAQPDQPDYAGQLNKIYLLPEYQRRGLGRRLMGHVARRFLEQGITSMLLFADTGNPSCAFYEALGGEKLRAPDGTVADANYGWRDLRRLADLAGSPAREMQMSEQPDGPAIHEVFIYLCVRGGEAALGFYTRVFGARETFRLQEPSGRVAHAELRLGPATLMLADEHPEHGILSPLAFGGTGTTLHLHVDDVDELARRAADAGAVIVFGPADQAHGERQCRLRDPFGHEWLLGHSIGEPMTPDEIRRRFEGEAG